MATPVSIDRFKSLLGRPSLTSKYYLELALPRSDAGFRSALANKGIQLSGGDQENLNLYCTEASLPGSSIATLEQTSDRTGVTERHAHRRVFDDRIDFTFYVESNKYLTISFFEAWMDYITGSGDGVGGQETDQYFYRMNYPDDYTCSGMKITKFERDSSRTGSRLTYNFVKAFPISINSMPVSYDSSQLLKCTVSMTYIRYNITPTKAATPPGQNKPQPEIPSDFDLSNPNLNFDIPQIKTNFNRNIFAEQPDLPIDFSRTDLPSFL
jgi:hypothetical protein